MDKERIKHARTLLREIVLDMQSAGDRSPLAQETTRRILDCATALRRLADEPSFESAEQFHNGLIDGARDRASLPMRENLSGCGDAYQAGYKIGYAGKRVRL